MKPKHVIYTVKGINTGAENWGDSLRRWCAINRPDIAVEEVDWGKIGPVRMYAARLFPFLNWSRQDDIATFIANRQRRDYAGVPFSIIAHSFGTFLVHGALWRNPDLEPRAVILVGSVLPDTIRSTRLGAIVDRRQVQWVLNVHSYNDTAIRMGSWPPYGKAGYWGFRDAEDFSAVSNVRTEEEHSSYFWSEFRATYFEEWTDFCVT